MRRVCLVILSAALVAAVGCGRESYEKRLDKTIEKLKYQVRVNKALAPAVADKKFADLAIFLRTPKDQAQAKEGQLLAAEGQFDVNASFVGKADDVLDVLARVKLPKKAPTKGAAPAPALPPRGEFNSEVVATLTGIFGASDTLAVSKFKEETKRGNKFKRLIFSVEDNAKDVEVWSMKQDSHEVALIFVYPHKLKESLSSKIELCLETFAVGPKATRNLNSNGEVSEEAEPAAPIPL